MKLKKTLLIIFSLVIVLAAIYTGASFYLGNMARKSLDSFLSQAGSRIPVEYGSVKAGIFSTSLTISDFVIKHDELNRITAEKIRINDIGINEGIPTNADVFFSNLDIENNGRSLTGAFSEALGYEKQLVFDMNLDYSFNTDTGYFRLDNLELLSADAGSLAFSMDIENMALDSTLPERIEDPQNPATLRNAEIRFTDYSMTDRAMDMAAGFSGISPDDFKSLLKLQAGYMADVFQANLDEQSMSKLKSFIDTPDKLRIIPEPEETVTLAMLIGNYNKPVMLLKMLDIKIR